MASAWGGSWGAAWGNAWGPQEAVVEVTVGGGNIAISEPGRRDWLHEHNMQALAVALLETLWPR